MIASESAAAARLVWIARTPRIRKPRRPGRKVFDQLDRQLIQELRWLGGDVFAINASTHRVATYSIFSARVIAT